jgi:hypothetical protein
MASGLNKSFRMCPGDEMANLASLDEVLTELATTLYATCPLADWKRLKLFVKYSSDGEVSGHNYDYELDRGVIDRGSAPKLTDRIAIRALTFRHWNLAQEMGQRWFKMTVTVERSGKYSADFEYKNDYKETDMLERG